MLWEHRVGRESGRVPAWSPQPCALHLLGLVVAGGMLAVERAGAQLPIATSDWLRCCPLPLAEKRESFSSTDGNARAAQRLGAWGGGCVCGDGCVHPYPLRYEPRAVLGG